jgi:hypothetical protein
VEVEPSVTHGKSSGVVVSIFKVTASPSGGRSCINTVQNCARSGHIQCRRLSIEANKLIFDPYKLDAGKYCFVTRYLGDGREDFHAMNQVMGRQQLA